MNPRPLALGLLLLASCGPSRPEPVIPRYVVVTTIPPDTPMERSLQRLVRRRGAELYRFRSLESDGGALLSWLREQQPTYCALVLRPQEIDAAFQLRFLELACRLDDDPFPDFTWGYFPAPDNASLQAQLDHLEAAEAKIEKRLLRATRFRAGAPASEIRVQPVRWATNLPLREFGLKAGDADFLRRNLPAVEQCDFLLLEGDGSPDGLRGLPREEVERLRLDSSIVFSGGAYTGVSGTAYDASAAVLRRRTFDPETSLVQILLRGGAGAVFAPLDRGPSELLEREWTDAILSDEPLGWVMKHGYDLAILAAGGSAPSFDVPADGRPAPSGFDGPLAQTSMRVLYGDPSLKLYSRDHTPPFRYVSTQRSTDREGREVLQVTWRILAWDVAGALRNPFGGPGRTVFRVELPRGTTRAQAAVIRSDARGTPVEARVAQSAVEQWRGTSLLHLLIQGKDLAVEDLVLTVQIVLN